MAVKIPIIIYDIEKRMLGRKVKINSSSFYFYSYQNISVQILNPDCGAKLYSVKNDGGTLIKENGINLTGNFGYTLYVPNNKSSVLVKIMNAETNLVYGFLLELDNIIDETNTHYIDLLVNNNLPSLQEILPALTENTSDVELIKRLLLDFKEIIRYKGTKKSISQILQFVGLPADTLIIFEEYLKSNGIPGSPESFTVLPNKQTDTKTGNYHILFTNYSEGGLDDNNMPIRNFIIEDLEAFKQNLIHTISLANVYFTLKEQDITFFGMTFSSNIAYEPGVTSYASQIFHNNVMQFHDDIKINLFTHTDSVHTISNIVNNKMIYNTLFRTEVKIYQENLQPTINKIYLVDGEIFDDTDIPVEWLDNIRKEFGIILHLTIDSPNTYIEFEFVDIINPLIRYKHNRFFNDGANVAHLRVIILNNSTYKLSIKVNDNFNNVEYYYYELTMANNIQRIDFEAFNSVDVSNANKFLNNFNLDIDTPNKLTNQSLKYVVDFNSVPNDLANYFNIGVNNVLSWLGNKNQYILPEIKNTTAIELITDTIPYNLNDGWVDMITFPFQTGFNLRLKVHDVEVGQDIFISIEQLSDYYPDLDSLYITVIDIYENEVVTSTVPYYIILSTDPGISIEKNLYDFYLVSATNPEIIKSIFASDFQIIKRMLPLNFDYPLFSFNNTLNIPTHIPTTGYTEIIEGIEYQIVRSIFPRLVNIQETSIQEVYSLNVGDVIFCRLNDKYVVNENNVNWKIYDYFNGKILFETNEYTLKYRVETSTVLNVICSFIINNETFTINKPGLFSSFKL